MTTRRRSLMIFAAAVAAAGPTLGCTIDDFLRGVAHVSQGSQYLGTLLDVAEMGARAYFNRHPSIENEPKVDAKIRAVRLALQALDASIAAAQSAEDGDVVATRDHALEAYDALLKLLDELGIPQAKPPAGGAETDAPEPEPFELPPADKVRALFVS